MHITKSKPTLSPSPSPPSSSSLPSFIILVLAIILICVNNVDGALTSVTGRYGHTATLIDNKLYQFRLTKPNFTRHQIASNFQRFVINRVNKKNGFILVINEYYQKKKKEKKFLKKCCHLILK